MQRCPPQALRPRSRLEFLASRIPLLGRHRDAGGRVVPVHHDGQIPAEHHQPWQFRHVLSRWENRHPPGQRQALAGLVRDQCLAVFGEFVFRVPEVGVRLNRSPARKLERAAARPRVVVEDTDLCSLSQALTVTRVLMNPVRLNVQQPRSTVAVANDPKALLNVRDPTTSLPWQSSYSGVRMCGRVHSSSAPTRWYKDIG